jgi:hypothetical protein
VPSSHRPLVQGLSLTCLLAVASDPLPHSEAIGKALDNSSSGVVARLAACDAVPVGTACTALACSRLPCSSLIWALRVPRWFGPAYDEAVLPATIGASPAVCREFLWSFRELFLPELAGPTCRSVTTRASFF